MTTQRPASAAPRVAGRFVVRGPVVDAQTRCIHYAGPLDVIAIRFACCSEYYPCHRCHQETADHAAAQWPLDQRETPAVMCGVCGGELTITAYLDAASCPRCGAGFNPGCAVHRHLYFD